jgi:hypothetical protein
MTYTQVLNRTISIYREKGELAAYEFVSKEALGLVGDYPQIDNFRYALAAAVGRKEEAMAIMRQAIVEKGYWYSYDYLTRDEDLNSLRKEEDFIRWLDLCKEREQSALANPESKLLVEGKTVEEKPLFLVLHGDQENIEITRPYWNGVLDQGYVLALLQSSQIEFSHGYNWRDVNQGVSEVGTYFEALMEDESVSKDSWIGGFSAGCNVGLRAILDGAITANRFVFVAPWLPDLEEWKEELSFLKDKGISGHILVGDQDHDCLEGAEQLAVELMELGVHVSFEKIEGLAHDYPIDFQARLKDWIY